MFALTGMILEEEVPRARAGTLISAFLNGVPSGGPAGARGHVISMSADHATSVEQINTGTLRALAASSVRQTSMNTMRSTNHSSHLEIGWWPAERIRISSTDRRQPIALFRCFSALAALPWRRYKVAHQ
jgi:hypothetical protein